MTRYAAVPARFFGLGGISGAFLTGDPGAAPSDAADTVLGRAGMAGGVAFACGCCVSATSDDCDADAGSVGARRGSIGACFGPADTGESSRSLGPSSPFALGVPPLVVATASADRPDGLREGGGRTRRLVEGTITKSPSAAEEPVEEGVTAAKALVGVSRCTELDPLVWGLMIPGLGRPGIAGEAPVVALAL